MNIDANFLILAAVVSIFVIGIYCMIVTQNLIRLLIGLEIIVKSVTLLFIYTGNMIGDGNTSQSLIITLIIIEVVVMVVACGIVLGISRHNKTLDSRKLRNLKE
jgi:NADH-quinone oxidoreductase subunit K